MQAQIEKFIEQNCKLIISGSGDNHWAGDKWTFSFLNLKRTIMCFIGSSIWNKRRRDGKWILCA